MDNWLVPEIKKDAESGIETLLVLVKKHPSNIVCIIGKNHL